MINGEVHSRMTPEKAVKLIEDLLKNEQCVTTSKESQP
jgi:hypothetical protein